MRIVIIGAGAMGSLFGAMLSSVSDVFLVDPYKEHVQAINDNGLIVEKINGTRKRYPLCAYPDSSVIGSEADLAIIFTKSYLTEKAAHTAKQILKPGGLALTLQNGLGNMEVIAKVLGPECTAVGVTSHGGTLLGPGRVRHAGSGLTCIGGAGKNEKSLSALVDIFNSAGIETVLSKNLDSLIWGKLVINAGINALTSILRVPNGVLEQQPECKKIMARAVSEAVAVAGALGIKLPYENPVKQVAQVCKNTAKNKASMLQDVLRGARTEVDVINRAIVEKGKETGIPTPYNLFLSEIIEALEATSYNRCNKSTLSAKM